MHGGGWKVRGAEKGEVLEWLGGDASWRGGDT